MARLFLAIWPDERVGAALERLAQDVALVAQGKPVERAKIHLTLVFIGEVEKAREGAIAAVAQAAARTRRCMLVLDRVGSFRRSRVGWAGASVVPAELAELQARLEGGLRGAGFQLEERPYRAHVTLARKIALPLPMAAIEPMELACDACALVVSEGGKYRTLRSWALA
jgi:2'-5' RNA ligase